MAATLLANAGAETLHPSQSDAIPLNTDRYTLSNGQTIPANGHGSMEKGWFFDPTENARIVTVLSQAIRHGLRLIDTAKVYATEELVGRAIRESGVDRSEIVVVSKLWNTDHGRVVEAFEETMNKLALDYIDIYIMHWPCALGDSKDGMTGTPLTIDQSPTFLETYAAMETLIGPRCRGIGVSNFTQRTLTTLLASCRIPPVVNEIEVHPLFPNRNLVPFCLQHGIRPLAWGPLAGGPRSQYGEQFNHIYTLPSLMALAEKYFDSGEKVGDVVLSWLFTRGVVAIPHAASVERIVDNLRVVRLSEEDVKIVNGAAGELGGEKMCIDAAPVWSDDGPGGKGRTIFGWTPVEIGWVDEEGTRLV